MSANKTKFAFTELYIDLGSLNKTALKYQLLDDRRIDQALDQESLDATSPFYVLKSDLISFLLFSGNESKTMKLAQVLLNRENLIGTLWINASLVVQHVSNKVFMVDLSDVGIALEKLNMQIAEHLDFMQEIQSLLSLMTDGGTGLALFHFKKTQDKQDLKQALIDFQNYSIQRYRQWVSDFNISADGVLKEEDKFLIYLNLLEKYQRQKKEWRNG